MRMRWSATSSRPGWRRLADSGSRLPLPFCSQSGMDLGTGMQAANMFLVALEDFTTVPEDFTTVAFRA